MFTNRKRLQELEQRVADLERRNETLRTQLATAEAESARRAEEKNLATNRLMGLERLVTAFHSYRDSLSSSQAALAGLAEHLQERRRDSAQAGSLADDSRSSVERVTSELEHLATNSRQVMDNVVNLQNSAQQIGGIVDLIKDIANQTNLLALNAAIEAARAGESGRGFAVVADEVRKLADRTTHATADISKLVTGIQAETASAHTCIGDLDKQSASFKVHGDHAASAIGQIAELTRGMGATIAATSLRSFIELVKIDHLLYKLDVYHVLTGASERTHGHFSEAADCRLGKWYYEGEGRDHYSQLDGFRAVEAPHTEFHRQGRAAVDAYHAGDIATGSSAIEQMEKASAAVLESLERVARSGEQAAGHLVS